MVEAYSVRGYHPWMIGDVYVFGDPVPDAQRRQRVDYVIELQLEAILAQEPAPTPVQRARIHFINKEWDELPKNFVRSDGIYLYAFRPARVYPVHLDLLRNESASIARFDRNTGLFRVSTTGWEPVGEGD